MRVYALLLLLVVGGRGIEWKAVHDFEDTFSGYTEAVTRTIASIENILVTSREESESFLNSTYSNYPFINKITILRSSDDLKCLESFIDEEKLNFSFQIQIFQLQNPLRSRVVDIKERLSNIKSSIDIYQGIAESKFRSCGSQNGSYLDETNDWLQSAINSLSCAIYPNCSHHSIRKRSLCSPGQFRCSNGACIQANYFCDGDPRDCGDGSDEPSGCVRNCQQFRCNETFRCIAHHQKCDGINDCGDMSDEEGCPTTTTLTPSNSRVNCSKDAGNFLCDNNKCINLELTCDGQNDCGDWSDEKGHCDQQCSLPECARKGGVCFTGPKGSQCLYECPPGTYETSKGCNLKPEAPLATLTQVLEDTPRLIKRYAARLKYLKTKTIMAVSNSLREVVKCMKDEFTLLSKIIDFSTSIQEEKDVLRNWSEADAASPRTPVDVTTAHTEAGKTKIKINPEEPSRPFVNHLLGLL